jgi:hypothetical protein
MAINPDLSGFAKSLFISYSEKLAPSPRPVDEEWPFLNERAMNG